jgi:hypothetical protein
MNERSDPPCKRVLSINMLAFFEGTKWNSFMTRNILSFSDWLGVVKGSNKLVESRKELLFVYTFTMELEGALCHRKNFDVFEPSAIGWIKRTFYSPCNFQVIKPFESCKSFKFTLKCDGEFLPPWKSQLDLFVAKLIDQAKENPTTFFMNFSKFLSSTQTQKSLKDG